MQNDFRLIGNRFSSVIFEEPQMESNEESIAFGLHVSFNVRYPVEEEIIKKIFVEMYLEIKNKKDRTITFSCKYIVAIEYTGKESSEEIASRVKAFAYNKFHTAFNDFIKHTSVQSIIIPATYSELGS